MKLLLFRTRIGKISILILIVLSLCAAIIPLSAMAATKDLTDYITTDETEVVTDQYAIYGNKEYMTEELFDAAVRAGSNKIYLHYRTDRSISLYYDALLCVKNDSKIYSYEFLEMERSDADFLVKAIKSFINMYKPSFSRLQATKAPQKQVAENGTPLTFVNCTVEKEYVQRFDNRGYVVYHVGVSKYDANSSSQLYIVTLRTAFVPGAVARNNGDKSYGSYNNGYGYVHIEIDQAFDANEKDFYGIRYGGLTYKKDYWPLNEPAVITINSSVQAGLTLGYSFKNGFSKDNISVSTDRNCALNVSFGYSKSITKTDPALTVQPNSSNLDEVQWYYKYASYWGNAETYHLESNYLFELSSLINSMKRGDFRLKLNIMMATKSVGIAKEHNTSADLFVGADSRQVIYPFDNGKI